MSSKIHQSNVAIGSRIILPSGRSEARFSEVLSRKCFWCIDGLTWLSVSLSANKWNAQLQWCHFDMRNGSCQETGRDLYVHARSLDDLFRDLNDAYKNLIGMCCTGHERSSSWRDVWPWFFTMGEYSNFWYKAQSRPLLLSIYQNIGVTVSYTRFFRPMSVLVIGWNWLPTQTPP